MEDGIMSHLFAPKKLEFKKLTPNATLPSRGRPTDAGLDIKCTEVTETSDYIEYSTGLAVKIPRGYTGLLFPRSSISNYHLSLCNSVGVVDHGYLGEIKFRFNKVLPQGPSGTLYTGEHKLYEIGDRIGQLIVLPIPEFYAIETDDLGDSIRGGQGFGSSGVK